MSDSLQFERAEYADAAAAAACGVCGNTVTDEYFSVGNQVHCGRCADQVRREHEPQGNRFGRGLRAVAAGTMAAVFGTLVYYGVLAATGYEIGLIAIAVGYIVGLSVRSASGGRGGWAYQTLAVVLTYLSIVTSYVPMMIQELAEEREASAAEGPAEAGAPQPADVAVVNASATEPETATFGRKAAVVIALLAFACVSPFVGGAQNIVGLIIIGIGLYEAWKLNRRVDLEISGPHPVNAAPSPAV
jgi:hypothetical protein